MDLNALRELHAPARRAYERHDPRCEGCDSEGFESESPAWPCRTALLLWDDTERETVLAEWQAWVDAQPKPKPASNGALGSLVPAIWTQRLLAQAEDQTFWKTFARTVDPDGSDGQ